MALIPRTKGRVWTRWAQDRLAFIGITAFISAVEFFAGPYARNDFHDALGVMALLTVVAVLVVRRKDEGAEWWEVWAARLRRLGSKFGRVWVHLDLDLRRTPPLARRHPRAHTTTLCGAFAFALIGAWLGRMASTGAFELRDLARYFYTGYLVLLSVSWLVLVSVTLALVILPVALAHVVAELRRAGRGPRWRVRQGAIDIAYVAAFVLAVSLLPAWIGLAVLAGSLATTILALTWPGAPTLDLIWWPDGERRGSPCVLTWTWFLGSQVAIVLAALVGCSLLFGGQVVFTGGRIADGSDAMPVTSGLAVFFIWAAAAASTVASGLFLRLYHARRRRDPARDVPTTVVLAGAEPSEERRARALLKHQGLAVRRGLQRDEDVLVQLEDDVAVGLRTSLDALDSQEVLARIARRDQIQRRRLFFRGLERIFKSAAGRKEERGEGYWLAPHQWFVPGLARDGEEELTGERIEAIGPLFDEVMSHAVTSHVHQVLSALEVDLIFVEDGVGYRRLRRVLRILFDTYDMFGGSRRLEERHLSGISGVRALIHDFTHERPFAALGYPEPDYDIVGRARILHVFKDRGENDVMLETPVDFTARPVIPMGV